MSNNKTQLNIYRLEEDHEILKVIEKIQKNNFKSQRLSPNLRLKSYDLSLFYRNQSSEPTWKNFVKAIAKSNQPIVKHNSGIDEGFVLLLKKKNTSTIYSIVGGSGYFAIHDFIDQEFGIDVLSHLIQKEDKIIRSSRERGFIGSILGSTKFFRSNLNLYDSESFGNIYQELKVDINKELLVKKFGFDPDELKRGSVCIAKTSFRLTKAMDFGQLLKIINSCELALSSQKRVTINNIRKLSRKKDEELIKKLERALYTQLFSRYNDSKIHPLFDLCHRSFERYLTATKYKAVRDVTYVNIFKDHSFDQLSNIDTLFEKLKEKFKITDLDKFIKQLSTIRIVSEGLDGEQLTSGLLIRHVLGDVQQDGKKFFFIDGYWYRIEDEFLKELDIYCGDFLKANFLNSLLPKKWDCQNKNEGEYNLEYLGDKNTLVLDKVLHENIEICDILKWDENYLYLCHVKEGFGNTMRDLCAQVFISANRLRHDLVENREFISKLYDSLKSKKSGSKISKQVGDQANNISKIEFQELFTKKVVYVLAVLDNPSDSRQRDIREIKKFKSTIAKFSIRDLARQMRGLEQEFKVTQIDKL